MCFLLLIIFSNCYMLLSIAIANTCTNIDDYVQHKFSSISWIPYLLLFPHLALWYSYYTIVKYTMLVLYQYLYANALISLILFHAVWVALVFTLIANSNSKFFFCILLPFSFLCLQPFYFFCNCNSNFEARQC